MALLSDSWILHVYSNYPLFENRCVVSSRKWLGLLPSMSVFFFPGHWCWILGDWIVPYCKPSSSGTQTWSHKFSFVGPAPVCLLGSTGKLLLWRNGGMLVTDIIYMRWFPLLTWAEVNANRKKESLTYCFHLCSVYRNNFPVTSAGLFWGVDAIYQSALPCLLRH